MSPLGLLSILLLVLIAATLAFPVYQGLHTGGILYYVNGLDESSYLNYAFSRGTQGPSRPGQYLVTALHDLGLAGGWINATLDAVMLAAFGLLAYAAFRKLGWPAARAGWGAAGMLLVPVAANCANPVVASVHDWTVRSGTIAWLNVAELFTPALVRSPEPQTSLVILAVGVLAALARQSYWPAYLVMPFMYPFVAIPATFVLLSCHMHAMWPRPAGRWWGPLLLAFLAIGLASAASYVLLVPPVARWLLVDSRAPFVSFSGLIALALYGLLYRTIEPAHRFFALALALATTAASAQQLISGTFAQPDNYEHYFGCFAIATIWILGTIQLPRWRSLALGVGLLCFLGTSYVAYRSAYHTANALPWTPRLAEALRDHPQALVIDDVPLASLISMAYPRQPGTALAFEKSYYCLNAANVGAYRCLKWQVQHDPRYAQHFAGAFHWLDDAYTYASADPLATHMARRRSFHAIADVTAGPCEPPPVRPLDYMILHP